MERFVRFLAGLEGWRRAAVAFLAGGLSALALAPVHAFPVLWLTMPVLVWLVDGAGRRPDWRMRARAGAAIGWCFGFGYFLGGLWWIGAAFLVDGDLFAWALPFAVAALPAGLALFWALGIALAATFWTRGWTRILVLAVALSAVEWLRGNVLTGFPWNAFGYVITPFPVMMQTAALIGLWGLTLLAFIVFAAPAALWPRDRSGGRVFAVVAGLLMVAHVGYGIVRLSNAPDENTDARIRIVQPALEQSEKWQAINEDEIVARYLRLSAGDDGLAGIRLLIWPESAFPFLLSERQDVLSAIADLLPEGATLVTGAVRSVDAREPYGAAYNSVMVIDDAGTMLAAYDKVHLVPFGEYLPFETLLSRFGLRHMIALPEGFTPGQTRMMVTAPGAPPFAPLICYEIIFPGAVLPAGPRPGWLLNVTNDGWFGMTPGPYQHFLQGRLRTVETGVPLVRAANSGISAIVDGYGRVQGRISLGQEGIVDGYIPQVVISSLYTQLGDAVFVCLLLCCLGIVFWIRPGWAPGRIESDRDECSCPVA